MPVGFVGGQASAVPASGAAIENASAKTKRTVVTARRIDILVGPPRPTGNLLSPHMHSDPLHRRSKASVYALGPRHQPQLLHTAAEGCGEKERRRCDEEARCGRPFHEREHGCGEQRAARERDV
jgi:hypothetical protein